ncbi:DUF5689 domain-containing protein [Pedobacter sp. AW31-3R]|uniref:DUF5689 domain-containing protein n=1 Tax=Pedobacter sp. AW31-3R TaxID=3445781 RepID=UPI003FA06DC3
MRLKKYYLLVLCMVALCSACKKHDDAEGTLSSITFLEEVRLLYTGTAVTITKAHLMEATTVGGVVISNLDSGNVISNTVVIQNTRRNKTRGIVLALNNAADYKPGDSLSVTVEGAVLEKVNGSLQLTGLAEGAVRKISSGNAQNIQTASSYNISLKPGEYESTLVKITGGTVNPAPKPGETMEGDKSVVNGADSIILHTAAAASFASAILPAGASFAGIVVVQETVDGIPVLQLWPRTSADITDPIAPTDPDGPELGKLPVLITGFVNDSKGADGNYEYFQFMATRDIDFSETPMSVVTCTNAGAAAPYAGDAPGGGWATGGGRTYKFNLTSGTVVKGEFFYVGGSNKKINGPNTTDISASKWISAIAYNANDGDGFGNKSSGLLPNSGNAGGIAIFEGLNVTETSVPVDAVFFGGTGKTTMYNEMKNTGYRIPDSDHYTMLDITEHTEQPFFFQGTNQYIIPHQSPADQGIFVKLGGVFNVTDKSWDTPRAHTFYLMSATSVVAEIETTDVTTLSEALSVKK